MSGGTIRAFSSMDNLSDKDRKVFEELSKQIDKLKTDLEAEKQKLRQLHRDKVLELKAKQEEFDRKLERSLEAQAKKREFDKQADLKSLEDKLRKQKEKEIKNIWRLKEDEIKRLKKQLAREKEDAIKDAVDSEKQKTVEKVHEGEDILTNKITQLTRDIFALNEHNSKLEEQVKLLTQENHDKIELMRRMKKEHESKLEMLVKQYKSDAMRESAKLKLAERRIQEKDQHLSLVEHKVDMANIEREAISDELSRVKKSVRDTPPGPYRPATPDLTNDRITPPSPSVYNPLQNRINDLQAHCKKVEEQVLNLKQDNAQLRKKLSKDGGDGSDINTNKEVEEKMKKLRKRNAELVSLAKQLDERCKALKAENEQLQSTNVSEDDKAAQQALRRQFARQQAKELTEHTKQLHAKDVELEALKQQVSKLHAEAKSAKTNAQPLEENRTGLLSADIAIVMKENLRMEKLLAACYQKSQEAKEVPLDPLEGFHAAENHMRQLHEQNTALHAQVKELTAAAAVTAGATSSEEAFKAEHTSEEITRLQKAQEESEQLASQLEKELEVVRHDNDALKAALTSQQSNTMELQEQCEQLKQSLAAETADCNKHKELVEQLRDECSRLQRNEENDSNNQLVSAEDMEQFTREVEKLKEENKRLLTASNDLSIQLSTVKKQYVDAQTSINDKERLAAKLTDELKRARGDKQLVTEELERTKVALRTAIEEREKKDEQKQVLLQQKESELQEALVQQQKSTITNENKTNTLKHSDEEKEAVKEAHKGEDEDLSDNQKQTENQKMEIVVANEDDKLSHQEAILAEKANNRPPITPRASASVPMGKKSAQKQLITKYGSPPKHISPKSIADLQSEFQQAGYEIEDGFDSEGDLNTFSELKKEEAECVSTTSLEDSLLGSESFISLDNYSQKHKQEKSSRVSSAKEKERKHSLESDKERKHSQESDKEFKRSQEVDSQPKKKTSIAVAVAAAMSPSAATTVSSVLMPSEQSLQEPSVNLAEEVSQASEATQPIVTTESKPSTTSDVVNSSSKDQTPNKASFWTKDASAEDDEDSSDSDSSDEDIVINKAVSSQTVSSTMSQDVALFVVKFDYDPVKMSPNPNPQQELTLTAGRYVYIYGEMDEDGFYKGQTVDGQQAGLVPSNFIERVNEAELVKRRQKMTSPRRGMLQHIDEEEENDPNSDKSSTATVAQLLPPENVQLVERSIDPVSQSVKMMVGWEPVEQVSTDAVGYSVYIDGELYSSVADVDTKLTELTGLLPNKNLTVTVRTCGADGRESLDQPHPLTTGRDLLSAPLKLSVIPTPTSPSLSITWTHPLKTSLYILPTHFAVLIDNVECCRVEASHEETSMTVEVSLDDITECGIELSADMQHHLIVRSIAGEYHSPDSESVTITSDLVSHLKNFTMNSSTSDTAVASKIDTSISSSVNNSLISNRPVVKPHGMFTSSPMDDESSSSDEDSSEDDVEIFSPTNRSIREGSLSPITRGMTNGTVISSMNRQARATATAQDQVDGMSNTARYYQAVYSYNPMMMSPNEGLEEQELCFIEGDIIKGVGDVDSDGFMEGELAGKKGLVPSNMIEEIKDMDKLQSLMIDHLNNSSANNHVKLLNGCLSRMVKARYSYNPGVDSPNDCNADEELCFQSGDVITVCGEVDDDGFFIGELNGRRGMVPSNFVEVITDDKVDGEDVEVFAASEEDMQRASQIIKEKVEQKVTGQSRKPAPQKPLPEKKRSLLKGKGLINRTKKK
ncbi:putative protein tag-278 isoform X3 [Dysidea avara]|uniref:putative protein tag-278 isoform X3 n=1 Tax=Dysidea avara TaxID=196820 RepID=UPI0033340FCF